MVERARLEIVYVLKRGIEGSNPSLSTNLRLSGPSGSANYGWQANIRRQKGWPCPPLRQAQDKLRIYERRRKANFYATKKVGLVLRCVKYR